MAQFEIEKIVDPKGKTDVSELTKEVVNLSVALSNILASTEKAKKNIADIGVANKTASDKVKDYNTALNQSAANQKALETQQKQIITTQAKINTARTESNKTLISSRKELKEQNDILKLNTILNDKNSGTILKAKAANKLLQKEKEKLIETDKNYEKELTRINALQDENNEKIKATNNLDQDRISGIGKYSEGVKEAASEMGLFDGALGEAGKGATKFGAVLKKVAKNPLLLAVILIIGAIAGLVAMFKKTQAGQDAFAKSFEQISAIVDVVIGRLTRLASAAAKLLKGDFKGAAEAAKGAFKGIKEEIQETVKAAGQIYDLKIALEELNITSTKSIAGLKALAEEQTSIADDATRSFKEREIASEAARTAGQRAAEQELALAKAAYKIIEEENKLKEQQGVLTRELRQQQADAAALVIESESNLTQVALENEKQRSELKQDRLEKDLDILIDGFDNQKTINERIIASDKKTIEERQQLLDDTIRIGEDSFNKQAETIQKFTEKQIDFNDLLATSDAVLLNEKIRNLGLSEIIEGRLLEVIREKRIASQDFVEAQEGINDTVLALTEAQANAIIANEERKYERSRMLIEASQLSEEEKANALFQLDSDLLQSQLDNLGELLSAEEEGTIERIDLEQQLADKQLELDQLRIDSDNAVSDNQKQNDEERRERLFQLAQDINGIGQQVFEFASVLRERNISDIEAKAEAGLITEEKAAKEIAIIKRKQFIADKIAALSTIAINTAIAVSKVIGQTGIFGLAAWIPVAALGALQAATVAAKPLPQYAEGTHGLFNTPSEFIAGEAGIERVTTSTGKIYMPDKATRFSGYEFKGAKVDSNKETESLMNQSNYSGYNTIMFNDPNMINEIKGMRKDIQNFPQPIYDSNMNRAGVKMGKSTTIYADAKFKNL